MIAIGNFEDFKKNFTLIESRLSSSDISDPTADIVLTRTWIEYVQRPQVDEKEFQYILTEALPKIVNALLRRRYTSNDLYITTVKTFLEECACLAAKVLLTKPEALQGGPYTLLTLLDSKHNFYQKLGHGKLSLAAAGTAASAHQAVTELGTGAAASTSSANKVDPMHATFISNLEVSDCVDFESAPGVWEVAAIDSFSPSREGMNITLIESEYQLVFVLLNTSH
jgi:hypothetical protein